MIGLVLTAILITTLFSSFRQMIQLNHQVHTVSEQMHPLCVMQLRMSFVFEQIYPEDSLTLVAHKHAPSTFRFTFNNRLDQDPRFIGLVEGELVLDEKQQLCLVLQKEGHQRKEVLLCGAKAVCFEVFDPETGTWQTEYAKNAPLPPMVRFQVDGQTYPFFLPRAEYKVVYS